MEQNEENLYKLLCALKSKLQQKFYADSNNRKPTICTDDALKLIAKYKPQTIEDMKNINGIGENFIALALKFFSFLFTFLLVKKAKGVNLRSI